MSTSWYGTVHVCIHTPEEWETADLDFAEGVMDQGEALEELAERLVAFAEALLPHDWHATAYWAA